MKNWVLALTTVCTINVAYCTVLGVPKSKQHLYPATGEFKCFDGSKTIAATQINDDFCDCTDGSDEPGTCHVGEYVASSRVDDGICDCCDGSDETHSRAKCSDTCREEGAAFHAARAEEIAKHEAGARLKAEYVARAKTAAAVREAELAPLRQNAEALRAQVDAARIAKDTAEAAEAAEKASRASSGDSGLLAGLGLDRLDRQDLELFVVQLVRSGKLESDTLVSELASFMSSRMEVAADGSAEGFRPEWRDDAVEEYESEAAKEARAKLAAAESDLSAAETKINNLEADSREDFGKDGEFYALKGECFSQRIQAYTYKICPFDSAKQDSTSLGSFSGFEDNYSVMRFTNGQGCWQGPARSLKLNLVCGTENAVSNVIEPSKCVYEGTFSTPAACDLHRAQALNLDMEAVEEKA